MLRLLKRIAYMCVNKVTKEDSQHVLRLLKRIAYRGHVLRLLKRIAYMC